MKLFFIKDFFSKRDQIRQKLRNRSHLPKKSLMENISFFVYLSFQINSHRFWTVMIKMMLFNLFRSEPEYESDSRFIRNSFICKCEERDYLTIWNWDYLLRSCFLLKIVATKLENESQSQVRDLVVLTFLLN